jgi:hypothetical protein
LNRSDSTPQPEKTLQTVSLVFSKFYLNGLSAMAENRPDLAVENLLHGIRSLLGKA